jgi:hypothetical protein
MDHRSKPTHIGVRLRDGGIRRLVVSAAAFALAAGVVLAAAGGHAALASSPDALSVTSAHGSNHGAVWLDSVAQPPVHEVDSTPTPTSTPVLTPTPTSIPSGGAPGSSPDPTPVPSASRTNTPSTGADLPFGAGVLLVLGGLALFAARRRSDTL